MSRPSYFDRSRNLQINGDVNFISSGGSAQDDPNLLHVNERFQASNAQSRAIEQGFKILCDNTAPSARYGYGHSFTGPQCHPGTRVAVQDHIFNWFDDENGEIAMWMHGPVGIGKSAIAQTVAHLAAERDQLSSAFFFFRSDDARNSAKHLVATLAYEMTQQMPYARDHVCQTVASNPLIFSSPLEHQIKFTLLGPASSTSESSPRRRLIVIDGLDECLDIPMQQVIIRSFMSTFLSIGTDTIPHKILIASRPESQIASAFSAADISPHVKRLALDSWDTEEDIQTFLQAKLDEIHQTHPLRHHLPDMWPDDSSFHSLLDRSVGSFAYASVAIRHLASHNNNPKCALRDLLSIQSTQAAAAFADLDALYQHILSSLDSTLRFILQKILCLHVYCYLGRRWDIGRPGRPDMNSISSYAAALLEDRSIVELALVRVSSLIRIDWHEESIGFHHTSFQEFLCDKARSDNLYAFSPNIASAVAAALSNFWLSPILCDDNHIWFMHLTPVCISMRNPGPRIDMDRQILNTLIETKIPTSFLQPFTVNPILPLNSGWGDISGFFELVHSLLCEESTYLEPADKALLNQAFNVVCTWLRSHLDLFFLGVPAVNNLIDFLMGDRNQRRGDRGEEGYKPLSFYIFCQCVIRERHLLLSNCIFRVFPEIEYTDICHAIMDRYIALPAGHRRRDLSYYHDYARRDITGSQLYLMVLYSDEPTIPSVCQRLEEIISAEQKDLCPIIGSPLTSVDYLLRFFFGYRCYLDSDGQLAIEGYEDDEDYEGAPSYTSSINLFIIGPFMSRCLSLPDGIDSRKLRERIKTHVFEIAETTNLYILRAHAENDFPYISAEVETICKIQDRSP